MSDAEVACPCGKKFRRKAAYDRHMEVAHSESAAAAHKCKTCGKTFGNSNTLTMHMSVHETKQNFAKLVRTRKASKTSALEKTDENLSSPKRPGKAEKSEETSDGVRKGVDQSEDSSSEKENNSSKCQMTSLSNNSIKSIVTSGPSSGVGTSESSKHDTSQQSSVLSEKAKGNGGVSDKKQVSVNAEHAKVKGAPSTSSPLPSLKEIIDSQSSNSAVTLESTNGGSAPKSKASSKSKETATELLSSCDTTTDVSEVETSKIPVTVNLLQSMASQRVEGGSGSEEAVKERGSTGPLARDSRRASPQPRLAPAGPSPIPSTSKSTALRSTTQQQQSVPVIINSRSQPASTPVLASTAQEAQAPSSVTSSHPAFAAMLAAPPATPTLAPKPNPSQPRSGRSTAPGLARTPVVPAPQASRVSATEELRTVAQPAPVNRPQPPTEEELLNSPIDSLEDAEEDDKLAEEDFDFITDEDLEALEQEEDDEDDGNEVNGDNRESRKSKRRRSENPIWKSLLTGKVYEEILNNLEGTPAKRPRKDVGDSEAYTEDMEDLPVKVEAIPQLDIKTEPFDPDFPDLDQLEAVASIESSTGSSDPSISPPAISPKMELTDMSSEDLSRRHFNHPGMSDKRSKSQSFDCFVCGKSFNSEKYLTMHISLHGTVKNADELLIPEADSPDSSTEPSPIAKKIPEVNGHLHPVPDYVLMEPTMPQAVQVELTPHQQLTQQVAALQQQSRQLQHQSALLQQQLQQQQKVKSNNNVKKSPPAVNRVVSEGGGWSCTLCNKTFAHNSGYKNHMRTHSNERPYVCTICDIGFKEKYHLKKHNLFIHSSELPEKCRFCGKRFKDSTAVRAHERIHSDERPFACRRCTKTFKTSECLWHHEHRSKTCGQALGDIIAKERAQRKRRKFPKTEPDEMKGEVKMRIKQEPETTPVPDCRNPRPSVMTNSSAAITAANAAIERNVQAIMMAEQKKATENQMKIPENQMQNELLMKIPEVVVKMEQDEHMFERSSCCMQQTQPFPVPGEGFVAAGVVPPPQNKPGDFVPPPVTRNQPNQTVISMLSQPPRPVQPLPHPPSTQPVPQAVSQIPIGRPIMSTMVKPVQHVQPQKQQTPQPILVPVTTPCQKQVLQSAQSTSAQQQQQQQQQHIRPLQQHLAQVVLPQQQQKADPAQPVPPPPPPSRPQPPQAVVQPQPRAPQTSNTAAAGQNTQPAPGDGGKDYVCKLCNKAFRDVSSFQRHCKIHTEERPFICESCDIGFKMKVHLKKHNLYVHSDEYPCECQHCGKRFKDSSAVKLHERTHSDSRPFQCDGCQKAFKTRENLWGHQHRGKCMATKNKSTSKHATEPHVGAHASVEDDHVSAQAYVSTSHITAQAIIHNNQVTAHATFNNSRVTARASIVNNKLHAQAYVSDTSDPAGGKSVDVKLEKPDEQQDSPGEPVPESGAERKSASPSSVKSMPTTPVAEEREVNGSCFSLEDPQALDASVLTNQMRAAISSTPVVGLDDELPSSGQISPSGGVVKPVVSSGSLMAAQMDKRTDAVSGPVSTEVSPTGTPSQTSPSAKWPTLKEFLAKGVSGTSLSPPAQVTNWFNQAEQTQNTQNNNISKMTTANNYPTIKERLMGSFFANAAAGVVDPPANRRQNTVGMVTRPHHHPPPPPGIPRIIPGPPPPPPPPPPYPGSSNAKLSPPPPYTSAKSPISVTTSPTAMEIANILSPTTSGGSIPSFQSTFLSKRTPPLPPISSLGSSPVMMRGEDPSIPAMYWDEDSDASEKEASRGSHWAGSGGASSEGAASSTDSMFHDMSLAEKMLTQL